MRQDGAVLDRTARDPPYARRVIDLAGFGPGEQRLGDVRGEVVGQGAGRLPRSVTMTWLDELGREPERVLDRVEPLERHELARGGHPVSLPDVGRDRLISGAPVRRAGVSHRPA